MSRLVRMPISRRLQLISLSFAAPIAVMAWLIVGEMNADIQFASSELDGLAYLVRLNGLLTSLGDYADAKHSSGAQSADGGKSVDAAVAGVASEEDLDQRLQFTSAGLAERKRDHATLDNFRKEWADLGALPTRGRTHSSQSTSISSTTYGR